MPLGRKWARRIEWENNADESGPAFRGRGVGRVPGNGQAYPISHSWLCQKRCQAFVSDFSSPVKKVRHIHQAEYINQQKVTILIRFQTNAISLELNRLPKGPFWRREISKSSQSTRGNPTIGQNHSACQNHWRKPTDLLGRKLEFEPGGI